MSGMWMGKETPHGIFGNGSNINLKPSSGNRLLTVWLKKYIPIENKIVDIKTATLWKKNKSTFDPDFCAVKLKSNPWIVQPFEVYEEIRIEDIKKKHQK